MARSATTRCEFCGLCYIRPCTAETQAECGNTKLAIEPQVSIRHHYIPVFYSKHWCGGDGKICEYSPPPDKIYDRRVVPKETGFQGRLYETKGVPKLITQRIEDDFMSSVDNYAAEALKLLETDAPKINGDQKHKSAWSLFLLSLLMCTPEDVAALSESGRRLGKGSSGLPRAIREKRSPTKPALWKSSSRRRIRTLRRSGR